MKKNLLIFTIVLLTAVLAVGPAAWAQQQAQPTQQVTAFILGRWVANGNNTGGIYVIGSNIGSQEFNSDLVYNQEQTIPSSAISIGNDTYPLTLSVSNGKIRLNVSSSNTDVTVNSDNFTLTFTSSSKYIIAASVTKNDGTAVSGCTVSGTYTNSVTVRIPNGKTFGKVSLTMTLHKPLDLCTIEGIDNSYVDDGVNKPDPTVKLDGQTLTKDVHYTVSYDLSVSDGLGSGTVTVTGIGEYTGSKSQNYNIRLPQLTDFTQLGDGAYEIATPQDMTNLARFVNSQHPCEGVTFRQTADISFSHTYDWDNQVIENNYTTIGCYGRSFRGTYDGGGHIVSGIRVYKRDDTSLGLFGFVGTGGTVKKVILSDARIFGDNNIGGIVGYLDEGGSVMDCYVFNTFIGLTKQNSYAWDIIAGNRGSTTASGTVTRAHFRDCQSFVINRDPRKGPETNIYSVTPGNGVVLPTRTGGTVLGSSGITLYDNGARINGTEYYNEGVYVNVSPASGYRFTDVTCTGGVYATDNGDGTWRIKMPAADVTVSATLAIVVTMREGRLLNVNGSRRLWATFYHPDVNFKLPAGVMACTMKSDEILYRVGDGSVIPAGCAVVLVRDLYSNYVSIQDITLVPTDETATPEPDNILLGSGTEQDNPYMGASSQKVYVLGIGGNYSTLGFYKFLGYKIPANKAYFIR